MVYTARGTLQHVVHVHTSIEFDAYAFCSHVFSFVLFYSARRKPRTRWELSSPTPTTTRYVTAPVNARRSYGPFVGMRGILLCYRSGKKIIVCLPFWTTTKRIPPWPILGSSYLCTTSLSPSIACLSLGEVSRLRISRGASARVWSDCCIVSTSKTTFTEPSRTLRFDRRRSTRRSILRHVREDGEGRESRFACTRKI